MFGYSRPTLQLPSQDVQSHLIRRPSSHVMPMVLVKKATGSSPYPNIPQPGVNHAPTYPNLGSVSSPYVITSGSGVNSIPAMNNPYLDAATSKVGGPFSVPPRSTSNDLTAAGSNFVLDSNTGTFTVLSPNNMYNDNNNNYIPSVQQQTTKKPFVRLPPVSNGFAPVSYSMASIGSPSMSSSPFLVSPSSSNNNVDPMSNPYSNGGTFMNQYVVSSANQVAATNNPYLDAITSKGTSSHSALPNGHFTSAGHNPYLNPSGSYPASSGSGFNSIPATNNPYLDAVASKDSNSYPLLPGRTGGDIASAGNNFLPDSNTGTFTLPLSNNMYNNNNNKRMVFPTAATTSRNPFLTSSKATFRVAIQ